MPLLEVKKIAIVRISVILNLSNLKKRGQQQHILATCKKLDEIGEYLCDHVCVVLATLIPACRKELERYCDIQTIESPFSVV